MFNLPSHLLLNRYNVFYFRISIPQDLRPYFRKREIKRSLKTSNRKEALRLAKGLAFRIESAFQELRTVKMPSDDTPPLRTYLTCNKLVKSPDGTVKIDGLELDPDKQEQELELLHGVMGIQQHCDL